MTFSSQSVKSFACVNATRTSSSTSLTRQAVEVIHVWQIDAEVLQPKRECGVDHRVVLALASISGTPLGPSGRSETGTSRIGLTIWVSSTSFQCSIPNARYKHGETTVEILRLRLAHEIAKHRTEFTVGTRRVEESG